MRMLFKIWQRKQVFLKRDLKKTHLFRLLGHKLFADVLWKIDKQSIAGGLSLGLFVAFMPTIGFQMAIVTLGAIFFKVNLPIGLVACWVTNPLTAIPIYTAAWQLGRFILENLFIIRDAFDVYQIQGRMMRVILNGLYLFTGCLVFSLVSSLTANMAVRMMWNLGDKIRKSHPHKIAKNKKSAETTTKEKRSEK